MDSCKHFISFMLIVIQLKKIVENEIILEEEVEIGIEVIVEKIVIEIEIEIKLEKEIEEIEIETQVKNIDQVNKKTKNILQRNQ